MISSTDLKKMGEGVNQFVFVKPVRRKLKIRLVTLENTISVSFYKLELFCLIAATALRTCRISSCDH